MIYILLFIMVFGCTSHTSSKTASGADTSFTVNNPPKTESPGINETNIMDGCYDCEENVFQAKSKLLFFC